MRLLLLLLLFLLRLSLLLLLFLLLLSPLLLGLLLLLQPCSMPFGFVRRAMRPCRQLHELLGLVLRLLLLRIFRGMWVLRLLW